MRTSAWDRDRFKSVLEQIRTGADLTAAELSAFATTTGLSRSQFNRWTNGTNKPTFDALKAFTVAVRIRYPRLSALTVDLISAAGYGDRPTGSDALPDPSLAVTSLRAAAEATGVTVGQLLVEHGLDLEDLTIPEDPPKDHFIEEIESDPTIPDAMKAKVIERYLAHKNELDQD